MASVTITRRATKTGPRYVVRYRLGGRAYPLQHAGSFKREREARARRDFVAGELAAARDPAVALRTLASSQPRRTLASWASAYESSRVDYADETLKNLASHLKAILPMFGEREPAAITPADVQEWIGGLALKPSSIRRYVTTLRTLLDFAGVEPNPARDRRVKLPTVVAEEPKPPTAKQVLAILDASPRRWRLAFVLMEQTGMRVGEVESLVWGDADVAESQFRLSRRSTKTRRPRWVQVPRWLMDEVERTCPLEDRVAERRVFVGFTGDVAKNVMGRACKAAKIPHFHPHDLRHRRISLWHGQGIPARELAERAGHARASMSLDVYSHVLMDKAELEPETLLSRCGPGVV
jgi:integrase